MSGDPVIDVSTVKWFPGYGPVEMNGPCDHDCKHRMQSVIAWGPTLNTYEQILCDDCGCRAWNDLRAHKRDAKFWEDRMEWRAPARVEGSAE